MALTIDLVRLDDAPALSQLLVACVRDGASVGFLADVTLADADRFWASHLRTQGLVVLAARAEGQLVGTVTAWPSGKRNAAHRVEVVKLLVSPSARWRGVGRALMRQLDRVARERGWSLLLLDTQQDSPAQRLYEAEGWTVFGIVPGHAATPEGGLAPTAFMYKQLKP